MSASEQTSLGASRVVIAGEMTIYSARDWRDRLLMAMGAPGDVELDLSGVSEIDAAGIQLLVSLRLEAADSERVMRLLAVSARVAEALNFCRLTEFFSDAVPAQASR
ncbi:MAG: STAS domain-containing protein [Zoogloea sp.]|nr:STAS domain-containing protein [Zoogloea sp.]